MLILGVVAGLVAGLAAGGRMWNLGLVRLRWAGLLFVAVVLRFTTDAALGANLAPAEALRLPLFAAAYGLLLTGLWVNRAQPGLSLAFVGVLGNAIAIVVNGGYMPVWEPSLRVAGFTPADVDTGFHILLAPSLDPAFFLAAGPLSDLIPIPLPFVRNVASIGDLFLASGLAFFLFATVVREAQDLDDEDVEIVRRRLIGLVGIARMPTATGGSRGASGLSPRLDDISALDRPIVLGTSGTGFAAPSRLPRPPDVYPAVTASPAAVGATAAAVPGAASSVVDVQSLPGPAITERIRRHPYVRLALNGSFSALWTGQLISLFGDRVHQIALAFLVYGATGSPIAVGFMFLVATLPNLLFSPVAGTFVDRWDHREVLVVSDLLRAAVILLIPIAAITNLLLVYPLVFLVTTISIFFRPARVAILPRIVRKDDLLPANSAMWVGDNLADVVGIPLAGLFVAFLGPALPLAFWVDAATYLASAVLIWTIAIPSSRPQADSRHRPDFLGEMREGWRFLRSEATLLANTAQATVAQFSVGILLGLTPIYAAEVIQGSGFEREAIYAFLETAIGIGNLVGGFLLGLVGARLARGRTIIVGYTVYGLTVAALALTGNLPMAFGLLVGAGIANMVFVIPSQTLFQERTPGELMGRVIGFRFALVFGSMTIAMGVGGILGELFGVAPVIGLFGLITMAAGLAGLLVPAVRDA